MATLTITVNSALGNNTTTLTFSGPDASRIFTAWKNRAGPTDGNRVPNGTQAQFVAWLSQQAQDIVNHLVTTSEQQAVVSPAMAAASS